MQRQGRFQRLGESVNGVMLNGVETVENRYYIAKVEPLWGHLYGLQVTTRRGRLVREGTLSGPQLLHLLEELGLPTPEQLKCSTGEVERLLRDYRKETSLGRRLWRKVTQLFRV